MVWIGDSITQATHDTAVLGGFVGRFADWALTQPGLQIRCVGLNQVDNHFPVSADPQYSESWGGYECFEFQNALAKRPDHSKVATASPMFGFAATSIHKQWIDFVVDACGANNINNGEPAATTWAAHLSWLNALRAALDAAGHTNTEIVVMGGYLDILGFESFATAANAGVSANVYDLFDAAHPTKPLKRGINWRTSLGAYNATNYDDEIHPNATGYNLIMNAASTGVIAVLGPLVLAAAANASNPMGSLSVPAENKLLDHQTNVQAYSPAATHYLHLRSGVGGTTPVTAGVAAGYAPASNANNTTTWPSTVDTSLNTTNGAAFTFPAPSGDWPDITGWVLSDNATDGSGTVLASHSHNAVPVGLTRGALGISTGPFSHPPGDLNIAAPAAGLALLGSGFTLYAISRLMSLMFGAVANTPIVTAHICHFNGNPQSGGTQAGSRTAMTQASVFGAASGGVAASIASVALADQATGNYSAVYDATSGGHLLFSCPRTASVGATGTLVAGQIALRLAA